jgi:ribosome maturation factor RimP
MNEAKKLALAEIERIVRETAASLGLEVIEIVFHSQGAHSLLRIDIDRPGMPGVGLADCEAVSRAIGEKIEDVPFFGAPYELQVSSPGIDRPIRTDEDLRRNTLRPVWLEFRDETGTVRELRGTLSGVDPIDTVHIASEGADVQIARERIVLMKQDVMLRGRKRNKP